MGFDRAAGRLVELGERQRGAQFEAAGFLRLRDGDGGEESGFGGGGVGGVLFEEDFAANAVEFGVEPAMSCMRCESAIASIQGCEGGGDISDFQLRDRASAAAITDLNVRYS